MKNVIIPCMVRTKSDTNSANISESELTKFDEIRTFAEERGIPLLKDISSKSGENIYDLLESLCEVYLKNERDFDKS